MITLIQGLIVIFIAKSIAIIPLLTLIIAFSLVMLVLAYKQISSLK